MKGYGRLLTIGTLAGGVALFLMIDLRMSKNGSRSMLTGMKRRITGLFNLPSLIYNSKDTDDAIKEFNREKGDIVSLGRREKELERKIDELEDRIEEVISEKARRENQLLERISVEKVGPHTMPEISSRADSHQPEGPLSGDPGSAFREFINSAHMAPSSSPGSGMFPQGVRAGVPSGPTTVKIKRFDTPENMFRSQDVKDLEVGEQGLISSSVVEINGQGNVVLPKETYQKALEGMLAMLKGSKRGPGMESARPDSAEDKMMSAVSDFFEVYRVKDQPLAAMANMPGPVMPGAGAHAAGGLSADAGRRLLGGKKEGSSSPGRANGSKSRTIFNDPFAFSDMSTDQAVHAHGSAAAAAADADDAKAIEAASKKLILDEIDREINMGSVSTEKDAFLHTQGAGESVGKAPVHAEAEIRGKHEALEIGITQNAVPQTGAENGFKLYSDAWDKIDNLSSHSKTGGAGVGPSEYKPAGSSGHDSTGPEGPAHLAGEARSLEAGQPALASSAKIESGSAAGIAGEVGALATSKPEKRSGIFGMEGGVLEPELHLGDIPRAGNSDLHSQPHSLSTLEGLLAEHSTDMSVKKMARGDADYLDRTDIDLADATKFN